MSESTQEPVASVPLATFPFAGPPEVHPGPVTVVKVDRRSSSDAAAVNYSLGGVPTTQSSGNRSQQTGTVHSPLPAASSSLDNELGIRLFPQESAGEPSRPADLSGIRLEHFEIRERIGVGGMGAVFKAMDLRLNRIVALKVLAPGQSRDPSSVQRFQHEAQAGARLDHDNIARVFHIGQDRGLHFIAFEYVTGVNLRDLIRSSGRLPPGDAVSITLQIASALRHTESFNVVHRDIKPSNIIITASGRAKLVDLGLARTQPTEGLPDLTVAGTTLGTFDYISPEQARDPRNVDIRSDIYSLGCTLYHMLTGDPPYPEGTVLQKLLDHQGGDAPDPAAKNRHVPAALSFIVRKMMSSDPRRRYATPDDLTQDLLALADDLGLRAVSSDGIVWSGGGTLANSFLGRHLPWMLTASALLVLVFALDRYPQVTQRILETAQQPPRQGGSPSQEKARPGRPSGISTASVPPSPEELEGPFKVPTSSTRTPHSEGSGSVRRPENRSPSNVEEKGLPAESGSFTNVKGESTASKNTLTSGGRPAAFSPGPPADGLESPLPPSIFDDKGLNLLSAPNAFLGSLEKGAERTKTSEGELASSEPRASNRPTAGETRTPAGLDKPGETSPGSTGVRPAGPAESGPRAGEEAAPKEKTPSFETTGGSPDKTTRPADPRPVPAIVVLPLNGGEPRSFPTIEAACTQAEDGQIIELRYNGPRQEPEKTWRIVNKRITIRAAKGFRPVIDFVLKDNQTPAQSTRMISLSGGSIELSHLDLRLTVSDQFSLREGEAATLFSLAGSEQMRLHAVSITVYNPSSKPATVVEISPPSAPAMSKMKMMAGGMPVDRPRYDIKLVDSLIRGNASLLTVRQTNSGQVELEHTAISTDGSLVVVYGGVEPASTDSALRLHLEHVTALVGDGLLKVDSGDSPRELLPIQIDCRNTLFGSRTPAPLVAMSGSMNLEDLRRLLRWRGEKNTYDRFESFWSLVTRLGGSEPELIDYDGWKRFWSAVPETSEVGSSRSGVSWKTRWWEAPARDLIPTDLEFDSSSSPAVVNAATDGSSLGADLLRLPAVARP